MIVDCVHYTKSNFNCFLGFPQEEIQEKHLRVVYLKIQAFWKRIARKLDLPEFEIVSCERSHSLDEERCYAMLQKWKTRQRGKGKVWDLASAIYKAELEGVVEEVYGKSVLKTLQSGTLFPAISSGMLGVWIAMRYIVFILDDSIDEAIYQQALASGSVPVNRYRVMVVGQDGAGKSCLIDSFLNRPFKARNPSTDGIAIHVAVTAAEGKAGELTWTEATRDQAKYLNKLRAAGYMIQTTKKHQVIIPYSYTITFDFVFFCFSEMRPACCKRHDC